MLNADFSSPYVCFQALVIVVLALWLFGLSYLDHRHQTRSELPYHQVSKMFDRMEFNLEYHNAMQTIYRNTLANGHKTRLEGLIALGSLGGLKYHIAHGHYYFYSDDGGFFTRIPEAHIQTR